MNQNQFAPSEPRMTWTKISLLCPNLGWHELKPVYSVWTSDDMNQNQFAPSEPQKAYPDNIFRIRCFLKPKKEMKSSITARFTIIKQGREHIVPASVSVFITMNCFSPKRIPSSFIQNLLFPYQSCLDGVDCIYLKANWTHPASKNAANSST